MSSQTQITLISALGTMLEWAEYILYGYLASQISQLFFPHLDPRVAVLAAFAVFAIGFFARPIGAIIFGHIGDRHGRRKALTLAMLTMGVSTFLIGSLPTYETIGIAAPILLIICRLLQGLAVSGEYNGAAIFLIEHHTGKQPHLAGSWIGAAAASGMVLGACIVLIVTLPGMPSWAWRMAFWMGSMSCFLGYYLRTKIQESPDFLDFQQALKLLKAPLLETLKNFMPSLLITAAIAAFVGIQVYICNVYFTSFLIHQSQYTYHDATLVALFGNLILAPLLLIMGSIADKTGARPLMFAGLFLSIMTAPMIYHLGLNTSIGYALTAQVLYAISNSLVCGPMYKYLFDLFKTSTRYSGISFGWSVSIALFGGTSPMIAEYLVSTKHLLEGPAYLVCISAIVAFFAIMLGQEESIPKLNGNYTHPKDRNGQNVQTLSSSSEK